MNFSLLLTVSKVIVSSAERSLNSWIYVPIGITCILVTCWGVDRLIHLSSVSFPASVALLILLFVILNISQWLLGDKRTRGIVKLIDIPADFALRWISIFFVPAFVLLPLSSAIGAVEIAKIIGVFSQFYQPFFCDRIY